MSESIIPESELEEVELYHPKSWWTEKVFSQDAKLIAIQYGLTAFAIGAMFGGFAGSFFATRQAFISPESFTFIESAIIVAIVVLGGMGSQTGVVLASIFLIGITEMFRDLEQYRMIAFGGAMVLIMVFKPKGILANRKPTILMHGEKK